MHLLQFSTSHYCRKARLALGYKGCAYTIENLTPGLHLLKLKPLTSLTTVPVLLETIEDHNSNCNPSPTVIADSSRILAYLDQHYPHPRLIPENRDQRDRALQLEDWIDESIGTATRFVYYQYRATEGKAIDPSWMSLAVIAIVRRQYGIHPKTVKQAAERLDLALPWIDRTWQTQSWLVGDALSVADIAAAALLSPLALIPTYRETYPSLFERIAAIHALCHEPLPPGLKEPDRFE
ncbi:MAG: glutathione S-transferase family protein [Oscillatoriales cyanobacterium]|nr:MAG: glutathione S-transferase family protein [Oscillatoriales cyanobacterium]